MKMDQTCPNCGVTEAAGSYCTKCFKTTEPSWLHKPRRGSLLNFGEKRPSTRHHGAHRAS